MRHMPQDHSKAREIYYQDRPCANMLFRWYCTMFIIYHMSPNTWSYMDFKKLICHTTVSFRGSIHPGRPCANISKKPCTLAVALRGLLPGGVALWPCWLGTAGFGLGGGFEETRVVGGDPGGLLLNWEGDRDRCSLLENPNGEGRRGRVGAPDDGFPKFVVVVVVSILNGGLNWCKEGDGEGRTLIQEWSRTR